jgi:hypothetical protein
LHLDDHTYREDKMSSDPNPFRYSPDVDRAESSTEAPADEGEDFTVTERETAGSAMSEDDEDDSWPSGGSDAVPDTTSVERESEPSTPIESDPGGEPNEPLV